MISKSLVITKAHFIQEIQRTAKTNGGVALGRTRFEAKTGIRESDWSGVHWRNWGEATAEAGVASDKFNAAFSDEYLLGKLAGLVQELGRFPVRTEMKMKRRSDPDFPAVNKFDRFGGKADLANKLLKFCIDRGEFDDIAALCEPVVSCAESPDPNKGPGDTELGFVYLMKSGRYYKIGRTNAIGRREYELSIQMLERAELVHQIKADDSRGIETYWHKRFADKRKNGEWFDLSDADVAAFRRRKFM